VIEPGRYISGPAGVLLTRVLYVKQMGRKTFVITDAGMNDLLRPSHYGGWGRSARAVSFLALDRPIEAVEPGEILVVRTAGAYGFSMASTYNARPRPAEVLVEGDAFRLIRRRETYEDLVRGEVELL